MIIVTNIYLYEVQLTITRGTNDANDENKEIKRRNEEVTFINCAPFTKCIS